MVLNSQICDNKLTSILRDFTTDMKMLEKKARVNLAPKLD
jgi:hypothetical protein